MKTATALPGLMGDHLSLRSSGPFSGQGVIEGNGYLGANFFTRFFSTIEGISDRHFDTAVPESSTPNLKSSLGPTWESPSAETLVPHQIVFLEWQGTRLYAEVIQVIRDRQVCWVRPLVLAAPQQPPILYASSWFDASDVSDATRQPVVPDLIWPIHQFRLALDEDVLPFLSLQGQKFSIPGHPRPADATPLHQLQQFVASFCSPQASNASDTTVSDNCDRP